jgi:hypothetical protein
MNKKYNLSAVNRCYTLLRQRYPEGFRKLPGNFSEDSLFRDQLGTTEFIRVLYILKVQIHDCKRAFYFHKSRKVPLGKFPPEKNPPENISDNFDKF